MLDDGDICRSVMAWRKAGRPELLGTRPLTRGWTGPRTRGLDFGEPEVLDPGGDLVPGGTLGDVTVQYRAVEFSVPSLWYRQWLLDYLLLEGSNGGGGLVSSTEGALAGIWPEFRAAWRAHRGLGDDEVDVLLGCYSLGPVADRSMFWREGDGSHREAFRHMVRLVVAYADGIEDQFQPDGSYATQAWRCEDLSDFVSGLLRGRAMADSRGNRCRLTINFDCKDDRYRRTVSVNCDDRSKRCGRWVNRKSEEPGRPFDFEWEAWEEGWDPASRTYRDATGGYSPDTDTRFSAIGGGFGMIVNPILLAWAGFTVDRILHRARIAWDYGRFSGDESYTTHARHLGRYALSVMTSMSKLMIHEIGHSYMGTDGHCRYGCCFEISALSWACNAVAALGLPLSRYGDDHVDARFSSGRFSMTPERTVRLHHEFGGDEVRLQQTTGGGKCSSDVGAWWVTEGMREIDPTFGWAVKKLSSDGQLCWTCTVDQAGVVGGAWDFCLDRAYQVFEAKVVPFTGEPVTVSDSHEWSLNRTCGGLSGPQDFGDVSSTAEALWCWRAT